MRISEGSLKNNPLVLAILTALFFSGWPVVTRFAGLPPIWVSITVCAGTLCTILLSAAYNGTDTTPATTMLAVGFLGGLLNGVGMITYSILVSNKEWDLSKYGPISIGGLVIFSFIAAVLTFGEKVTLNKIAGIAVIVLGIYILNRK